MYYDFGDLDSSNTINRIRATAINESKNHIHV